MNASVIDVTTSRVLQALADGERVGPVALQLLVRQYGATGREDIGLPLAAALGREVADPAGADRAELLVLCAEAARVSDDAQLVEAVDRMAADIARSWGEPLSVADAMRGVDACLQAASLATGRDLVPDAVDELERVVAREYEPGEGLVRGGAADQLAAASALLTAYDVTGRLPYAMLADELVRFVQRRWDLAGAARDRLVAFELACTAARVCCRLAALHADSDYRDAAVLAPGADYATDASRLLAAGADAAVARGAGGALYALALGECLALAGGLE